MSALTKKVKYKPEEYLALEEKADYRSEFWDGKIVKMSGRTGNHNTISLNLAAELKSRLRDKCRTFAIDVKVWINTWNSYAYPNVFVICGGIEYHQKKA